jgi:protein transport protein SEC31
MWDLRNSVSPLKEFVGHSKGVLGMAWSSHDSTLLLSSGKDNRTICWDVHTAETVCELVTTNWNFDVQWSPLIAGVFSAASYDGKVGLASLHACTGAKITEVVNADFSVSQQLTGNAVPLKKAPNWMKRACGATFGFGGKLVSFVNQKTSVTDATGQPKVVEHATISFKQVCP